jgi:hypothetical protein
LVLGLHHHGQRQQHRSEQPDSNQLAFAFHEGFRV